MIKSVVDLDEKYMKQVSFEKYFKEKYLSKLNLKHFEKHC